MPLRDVLYPQLKAFPEPDRWGALRNARETPFDVVELVGMAFGLVVSVLLTRYGIEEWDVFARAALALANFLVALPLLALLVGPFLVRRTRRGLDLEIARRSRP